MAGGFRSRIRRQRWPRPRRPMADHNGHRSRGDRHAAASRRPCSDRRDAITSHLATCARCRRLRALLEHMDVTLRGGPVWTPPEGFAQRNALRGERRTPGLGLRGPFSVGRDARHARPAPMKAASSSERCRRIVKSEDVRAACRPDVMCWWERDAGGNIGGQLHPLRTIKFILIDSLHRKCD